LTELLKNKNVIVFLGHSVQWIKYERRLHTNLFHDCHKLSNCKENRCLASRVWLEWVYGRTESGKMLST